MQIEKGQGPSEACLRGMDRAHANEDEHTIVATSSSAPVTVTSVAPFHYLINEQAKSILALQELQNEVSALLEFRDLVMETFPHLRHKMSASTAPSTPSGDRHYQQGVVSHIPMATSLQGSPSGKPRDWEPGIRVRRKLHQNSREQETSVPSLVPRSRSNSHGKGPKSGEAGTSGSSTGSSAVQDSGFCTESKEHCSTSSAATTSARKTDPEQEAEDELWNLLDLIHRKGTKLRLEVEHLQEKLEKKHCDTHERRARSLEDLRKSGDTVRTSGDSSGVLEVEITGLRRERDLLLDRLTEMEAENLANLAQTNQLLAEMGTLSAEKRDLEEQLRTAIATKSELNSRIHDLHLQFVNRAEHSKFGRLHAPIARAGSRVASSQILVGGGSLFTPVKRSLSNEDAVSSSDDIPSGSVKDLTRLKQREEHPNRIKRTSKDFMVLKATEYSDDYSPNSFKISNDNKAVSDKSPPKIDDAVNNSPRTPPSSCSAVLQQKSNSDSKSVVCVHMRGKVGSLDGIVSSPSSKIVGAKGVVPDKEKTAAILKEFNVIELQRHLLTTSFENQVANHKLERISKARRELATELDKIKEENDDLRFQLEEKSIELEGTRARVRLLERLQSAKMSADLSENVMTHSHTLLPPSHESTPNPILPHLTLPITQQTNEENAIHHSSSTESAHNEEIMNDKRSDSPRKRPPSRIPLKSYTAPKPPSGRPANNSRNTQSGKTVSKDTSQHSWNKKEKNWDPVTRSMKDAKRESPVARPASRESLKDSNSSLLNRRVRKLSENRSNQDGSFSSTNSTPSIRRDPPSSPAPKKITPPRGEQNETKVRPTKLSFLSNWLRMSGPS